MPRIDSMQRPVPRSVPPPVPASLLQTQVDPMLDMPTRHLLLAEFDTSSSPPPAAAVPSMRDTLVEPPPSQPPHRALTAPRSWSDEEGTAAIMLPDRPKLPPPSKIHSQSQGPRSTPQAAATAPARRWGLNLFMAAIGGLFVLVVLFTVGHFTGAVRFGAVVAPPQQLLIDEALFAVQTGHVAQAIGILERLQREQPSPDPMIDAMIGALKKRLR